MEIAKDDMKMIPLYVVVTILTTSSLSRCASLSNLYWDKRSVAVRQGDTVNVTCFSHTAINHVKHGLRIIHKDWPDTPMWDSATATSSDDRYSVMYHTSGLMAVAQLTIRDVQRIDAGSIGCTEDSADRTVTYTTLTVSPGGEREQGTTYLQKRHKRDYDWEEYSFSWDVGGSDDWWVSTCLPYILVGGAILLLMACICGRFRKNLSRTNTELPDGPTCTVEVTNQSIDRPQAIRVTAIQPSTIPQPHIFRRSDGNDRQSSARNRQEREALMSYTRPASNEEVPNSSVEDQSDEQGPPSYAEALNTSVYPQARHSDSDVVEMDELDRPPAYSTLVGLRSSAER